VKVLIVDDDAAIRDELSEFVAELGLTVSTAENGEEAITQYFGDEDIAILLTDLMMPGISGLEMLDTINNSPGADKRVLRVIFMAGNSDTQSVIKAMQLGATEFLLKPVDLDLLERCVLEAKKVVASERARIANEALLKEKVTQNEAEITTLNKGIQRAYAESLACLATAAEYKEPETGQHITRIGEYAAVLAAEIGWDKEWCDMIRLAAPLHDVGKVGMRDAVLLKNGPLDDAEASHMKEHPENGFRILSESNFPVMKMAARIALCHHERWDGTGYPRGLKGSQIPVEASITTLVDVYDALRSARPYKRAMTHDEVMKIITEGDGRTSPEHFRPDVLEAFKASADRLAKIFEKFADVEQQDALKPATTGDCS
jgi:putative two-component system response regulator